MHQAIYCVAPVLFPVAVPPVFAQEASAHPQGDDFAKRMLKEMDINGDVVVSREEYNAFYNKRFDEIDASHDGEVTRKKTRPTWKSDGASVSLEDARDQGTNDAMA